MPRQPSRALALLEALLVSLVWGSSFIIVKLALTELGPLTIGGLRYFIGFACLLPFLRRGNFSLPRVQWMRMALLGFSAYTLGNGAMFWALRFLPATTGSFLMSLITVTVLFGGIVWLREIPNRVQILGICVVLAGMALFFSPGLKPGEPVGLAIFMLALLGFTLFGLLSRLAAIDRQVDTLTLTAVPLAIGGGTLLAIALPIEGIPNAPLRTWGLVLFLAAVNTALGYVLYNHSLQSLQAFEMNVLLNLSPVWTALLGWILLGETLNNPQWAGMLVVLVGVMLVQKRNYKCRPWRLSKPPGSTYFSK
jgi:drug/metabolite transporter (DMT)-like permease